MAPKQDVSDERKAQIVEAATQVFARRGLKDARMDDIVKESGLSKGLLYWYFKNKDAVVAAVIKKMFEPFVTRIMNLEKASGTAEEKLRALMQISVVEVRAMLKIVPITIEFYSLAFRSPVFRRFYGGFLSRYVEAITRVIQGGIDGGEFIAIDARAAAIATAAGLEGTLFLWIIDPKAMDLVAQMKTTMETLIRGLLRATRDSRGRKER